jgi:transcriptional regulator with XRE-family HTH domain
VNLSQRALAERAGVSLSTVARIETGRIDPRATTLRALLRACDQDIEVRPRLGLGVDRTQIRERLKLTPAERIAELTAAAAAIQRIEDRAGGRAPVTQR